MEDIINTVNLTKEYGDVKAVQALNINVRKGEIYGFLGLNGAGKTTTIRMLLGLIKPVSGQAFVHGEKVRANKTKLWEKIGYLVEIPHSYPNLTVRENIEIFRKLRCIKDRNAVKQIMSKLELETYANRKAKNLSLGNKQRLGLAKALIHNPDILILDEPTNGLDPAGKYDIRELLNDLTVNKGVSIFISSHILGEISRLATRIGIIHNGNLVQEIDTGQLNSLCQKQVLIKTYNLKESCSIIRKKGYTPCEIENDYIKIKDESAISKPEDLATILVKEGHPPSLLQVKEEDLEAYFLRVIGKNGGTL